MMVCGAKYGVKWVICPTKSEQTRCESVIYCSLCGEFVPSMTIGKLRCEPFIRYFVVESSVFVPRKFRICPTIFRICPANIRFCPINYQTFIENQTLTHPYSIIPLYLSKSFSSIILSFEKYGNGVHNK